MDIVIILPFFFTHNVQVDSAVDRFANMRNLHEYRLKIDAKGVGLYFAITFGTIAALSLALQKLKVNEQTYRI